jgi:anti-anti-sigma factor
MGENPGDFRVDPRREGTTGFLRFHGEMRSDRTAPIRVAVERLLAEGARDLIFDLKGIPFVDSASIGILVRLNGEAAARGGRNVLCSVPRVVRRVLDATGLGAKVTIAKDEADARRLLGG